MSELSASALKVQAALRELGLECQVVRGSPDRPELPWKLPRPWAARWGRSSSR